MAYSLSNHYCTFFLHEICFNHVEISVIILVVLIIMCLCFRQCSDCCKSSDSDKAPEIDTSAPRRLRRIIKEPAKFSPSLAKDNQKVSHIHNMDFFIFENILVRSIYIFLFLSFVFRMNRNVLLNQN